MKAFTNLKIGEQFRLPELGRTYVKTGRNSYGYRQNDPIWAVTGREFYVIPVVKESLTTETPLTDEHIQTTNPIHYVTVEFARDLERELNKARQKLSERKRVHEWLNELGTPTHEATGLPMCLFRRLAVQLGVAPYEATGGAPVPVGTPPMDRPNDERSRPR